MGLPARKHPRLKGYDYSRNGAYFVTICTKNREQILSEIVERNDKNSDEVGRDDLGAPFLRLTEYGKVAERYLYSVTSTYASVRVDKYIIMPNHVHVMLMIDKSEHGAPGSARPTVSQIIGAWKRLSNRDCGRNLWQPSYYEHIIRDKNDYLQHWQYIDDNPVKWAEDKYYTNLY